VAASVPIRWFADTSFPAHDEKTDRIRTCRGALSLAKNGQLMADNIRRKPGALEAGREAIKAHFERVGQRAT